MFNFKHGQVSDVFAPFSQLVFAVRTGYYPKFLESMHVQSMILINKKKNASRQDSDQGETTVGELSPEKLKPAVVSLSNSRLRTGFYRFRSGIPWMD